MSIYIIHICTYIFQNVFFYSESPERNNYSKIITEYHFSPDTVLESGNINVGKMPSVLLRN